MNQNQIDQTISVDSGEDINYQAKLLVTSFKIRVFNLIVALVLVYVNKYIFGFHIVSYRVFVVLGVWLMVCFAYLLLFKFAAQRSRRYLDNVHLSYYFPGVICASFLVYFMGSAAWIGFVIYLFDLIYGNVLMHRGRGALLTAFIIVNYSLLVLLDYQGIIPHQRTVVTEHAAFSDLRNLFPTNFLSHITIIILLFYSTGMFSRIKEEREERLRESRNMFEAKSRRLEEMANALRKKAAEVTYLKRATMGYIEKKEYELESVKRDLEDQIGKLRKTQKSMFFMIEDLNEMSTQLKDNRDNLEEKVRERTDELLDISRKLHRSEKLAFLGKLAGSVTHELRNPLAVLKNSVYYMDKKFKEQKKKKDEKIFKYIDVLKKEISAIDSIINDIMSFAKTKVPELEEADVGEVIENAISTIKVPELIEIKRDFKETPRIKLDSNQVMHAVVNIANNAIIAMNGSGTLTFRAGQEKDNVFVEIGDTGPGIPADQRDLIFEPLYSSKPKGTGLGLPIAKMMIENQDGSIGFESELGAGTRFKILLPIERT